VRTIKPAKNDNDSRRKFTIMAGGAPVGIVTIRGKKISAWSSKADIGFSPFFSFREAVRWVVDKGGGFKPRTFRPTDAWKAERAERDEHRRTLRVKSAMRLPNPVDAIYETDKTN
jgi:hypothetical protein